ncbi:MAG: UDP-N-acetylglucosamine 1-carboxyvinyltransferase [Actinomycetota bacterium]
MAEGASRYCIRPAGPLAGTVRAAGMTKNAGCKQLAAALLCPGVSTVRNLHPVADLDVMCELLRAIGAPVAWEGDDALRVDATGPLLPEAPYELVSRMRASINVLGPLLARHGRARVAMPGGDNIGSRKLDLHTRGLQAMGVELDVVHGFIDARVNALSGARVVLDFPSVGATETLMTAAVLAKGETVIDNAAREPEISDLAAFLGKMGARIDGAGTHTITVEGVDELIPADHAVIGDRIEGGTYLFAAAIAGGDVTVEGIATEHLGVAADKLVDFGARVEPVVDGVRITMAGRPRGIDVQTLPFPGFATDFMPFAVAALAVADGTGIVTENVFDNRLVFTAELNRMGAHVHTEGRHAVVRGTRRLSGAPVQALDVRAGAALVLAGLVADGETVVHDARHVDRGYPDLAGKLRALGGDVTRVVE